MLALTSVAAQVFLLQVITAAILITIAVVAVLYQIRDDSEEDAQNRSVSAAKAFAAATSVVEALRSADPTSLLQSQVEEASCGSGLDFLVVMGPDGTRYADTDPVLIGTKAHGLGVVREGQTITGIYEGEPSDAARAIVPVMDADGTVVGMVGAGVEVETIATAVDHESPVLLLSSVGVLALATGSAACVGRRLRRQTRGIGPVEMTRLYEHHNAVLHAVREGVIILDTDGQLVLANDEARQLLELPPNSLGHNIADLGLDAGIAELLGSHRTVTDEVRIGDGSVQ